MNVYHASEDLCRPQKEAADCPLSWLKSKKRADLMNAHLMVHTIEYFLKQGIAFNKENLMGLMDLSMNKAENVFTILNHYQIHFFKRDFKIKKDSKIGALRLFIRHFKLKTLQKNLSMYFHREEIHLKKPEENLKGIYKMTKDKDFQEFVNYYKLIKPPTSSQTRVAAFHFTLLKKEGVEMSQVTLELKKEIAARQRLEKKGGNGSNHPFGYSPFIRGVCNMDNWLRRKYFKEENNLFNKGLDEKLKPLVKEIFHPSHFSSAEEYEKELSSPAKPLKSPPYLFSYTREIIALMEKSYPADYQKYRYNLGPDGLDEFLQAHPELWARFENSLQEPSKNTCFSKGLKGTLERFSQHFHRSTS